MKYGTLVTKMSKVITAYVNAVNGGEENVTAKILNVRHPEEERILPTFNTTIFDIEWESGNVSDKTTLVIDERDGSVHILSDMQSGLATGDLSDYDWTDLTAYVSDDDVA